ncbi:hypothetical protein NMG60_11012314 [Bertholletia excelsa]
MGMDWVYWGGGGGNRSTKKEKFGTHKDNSPSATGCMSAVLQLFDFHHFNFCIDRQLPSRLPEEPTILKGVEAPRNSLEMEKPFKERESLDIPRGIRIRTTSRSKSEDLSSECTSCTTPASKTPNLIARLMGLDLLPDSSLSSTLFPSRAHFHQNLKDEFRITGTRSLPETPRISLARRSDVDNHHRFSLQIIKENIPASNEFRNRKAKQIANQVKESVRRRVGADITNSVRRKEPGGRRDDQVLLTKPKKRISDVTPSSSSSVKLSSPPSSSVNDKTNATSERQKNRQVAGKRCKKRDAGERYGQCGKKPTKSCNGLRNKQEEPFVRSSSASNKSKLSDKKCRRTPISSELLNINVPTVLPVNKRHLSPATKLSHSKGQMSDASSSKMTVQLPSCACQKHYQETTLTTQCSSSYCFADIPDDGAVTIGGGGGGGGSELLQYTRQMIERTVLDINAPLSLTTWHSPAHPLHPSLFHHLEPSADATSTAGGNSQLDLKCNRILAFQLLDEMLAEILKPYLRLKPWVSASTAQFTNGLQLMDKVWSRIQRLPLKNCRVFEDIEELISGDLSRSEVKSSPAFEEGEEEGIVVEIELEILDCLLHEVVAGEVLR